MSEKKISEEISEKVQGSTLKKEVVDQRPEQPERAKYKARSGWGGLDSFAYAVKTVLDESRFIKGSDRGFLGKEKQVLNPKEQVDSKMLYSKKKK